MKDPDAGNQQTIRKAMENEHTCMKDAALEFTSSNGCTTTSQIEWEFAYTASRSADEYPERKGLPPEHRRVPVPLSEFMVEDGKVEREANAKLREGGHSLLILEEVLAGRLYTGGHAHVHMIFTYTCIDAHAFMRMHMHCY